MEVQPIKLLAVLGTGITLIAFEAWLLKRIEKAASVIHRDSNKSLETKVSPKQLIYVHVALWIPCLWLIGLILICETYQNTFAFAVSEWKEVFVLSLVLTVLIDQIVHKLLTKIFFHMSSNEISYRFNTKETRVPLHEIQSISNLEKKFIILLNSGGKMYIGHEGLSFLGWLTPIRDIFAENCEYLEK